MVRDKAEGEVEYSHSSAGPRLLSASSSQYGSLCAKSTKGSKLLLINPAMGLIKKRRPNKIREPRVGKFDAHTKKGVCERGQ